MGTMVCYRHTRRKGKLGRLKKRYRGSRLGGARGMTLIEALIALGILAIVAVVFLSGIASSYKATALARERTTAESLVRTQLETIKDAAYNDVPPYYDLLAGLPEGYQIALEVTPLGIGSQK